MRPKQYYDSCYRVFSSLSRLLTIPLWSGTRSIQSDNSALTARVVVSRGVIIADAAAVASLFYLRRARAAGLICYDPALSTVCCHIARHR